MLATKHIPKALEWLKNWLLEKQITVSYITEHRKLFVKIDEYEYKSISITVWSYSKERIWGGEKKRP
jgi:hypothetical protein